MAARHRQAPRGSSWTSSDLLLISSTVITSLPIEILDPRYTEAVVLDWFRHKWHKALELGIQRASAVHRGWGVWWLTEIRSLKANWVWIVLVFISKGFTEMYGPVWTATRTTSPPAHTSRLASLRDIFSQFEACPLIALPLAWYGIQIPQSKIPSHLHISHVQRSLNHPCIWRARFPQYMMLSVLSWDLLW